MRNLKDHKAIGINEFRKSLPILIRNFIYILIPKTCTSHIFSSTIIGNLLLDINALENQKLFLTSGVIFKHTIKFNKTKMYYCITWQWGAFLRPLLPWKSNKYYIFWMCVCSLTYQAWNAHASFCHMWPVRLYNIFLRFLINGTFFSKK